MQDQEKAWQEFLCKHKNKLSDTKQLHLLQAAVKYRSKDFSVIAVKKNKCPVMSWKEDQQKVPDDERLIAGFLTSTAEAIAIVCGGVSTNLEVIDVDTKNDIQGNLPVRLKRAIEKNIPGLFEKLYVVITPSKGVHIYYYCSYIGPNQKLAQAIDSENGGGKKVIIETRGEGGYIIAPPSPGYSVVVSNEIPELTSDERDALLAVCRSFDETYEEPSAKFQAKPSGDDYVVSPYHDFNSKGNTLKLLEKHGWTILNFDGIRTYVRRPGKDSNVSGDFHHELNLFKCFTDSTQFEANRAYKPAQVYAVLECNGDYQLLNKKLSDEGYGVIAEDSFQQSTNEILKWKKSGLSPEDIIHKIALQEKITKEEAKIKYENLNKFQGSVLQTFWDRLDNGTITINYTKLTAFIHQQGGFSWYELDNNQAELIRVSNYLVEVASSLEIKEFVKNYINSLHDRFDYGTTPNKIMEAVRRADTSLFSNSALEYLPKIKLQFLKDTPNCAYFPFLNGVVEVTENSIVLKRYDEIRKSIWKKHVTPFPFDLLSEHEFLASEYCRFYHLVSDSIVEKIESLMSLTGYLLHGYKDVSIPQAVILAEEVENSDQGGGTGKGIFLDGLDYLIPMKIYDGRNFKIDKSFRFQGVNLDTRIIAIDDCQSEIDFKKFYSQITTGINVENKFKPELFIAYRDSPKFIFTTNYTILRLGNHGKRRASVFEFGNCFNLQYTPKDEFKHLLFNDWDEVEWNRFYNFMFFCVQKYLKNGIKIAPASASIERKHIITNFSNEFLEWWDYHITNKAEEFQSITDMYRAFIAMSNFREQDYSSRKFKQGVDIGCSFFNYQLFEGTRSSDNLKRFKFIKK